MSAPKVTEKRVEALVNKWRKLLGLDPAWLITITLHRTLADTQADSENAVAFVYESEATRQADLHINVFNLDEANPLERAIVHELLHVLLARISHVVETAIGKRLNGLAVEVIESTTEKLTSAIMAAARAPKKVRGSRS